MTKDAIHEQLCPICSTENRCGNLAGIPEGSCWCSKEQFPAEIFALVPPEKLRKACICSNCLNKVRQNLVETKED
ncbi:MAG: cysteine-rich CWC family protein [Clostridia bacterium]